MYITVYAHCEQTSDPSSLALLDQNKNCKNINQHGSGSGSDIQYRRAVLFPFLYTLTAISLWCILLRIILQHEELVE